MFEDISYQLIIPICPHNIAEFFLLNQFVDDFFAQRNPGINHPTVTNMS